MASMASALSPPTYHPSGFASLPPEVIHEILSFLPVPSVLRFAQTSRLSHFLALSALQSLDVGIYHTRISSVISSIARSTTTAAADKARAQKHVPIILGKREARDKNQIIANQTQRLTDIISKYTPTLRSIDISAWALEDSLADLIASVKNLRHLNIRLDHPHVRHTRVPKSFWDFSPPSTVWNILSTDGGCSPSWPSHKTRRCSGQALGKLESITLERAGITDHQLLRLLERNPKITEIKLQKCLTLTNEFFEGLAETDVGQNLEILSFTRSTSKDIDENIFDSIARLPSLKSLNLHACAHLDNDAVKKMNDDVWHIPELVLPHSPDSPPDSEVMEVDPEYK